MFYLQSKCNIISHPVKFQPFAFPRFVQYPSHKFSMKVEWKKSTVFIYTRTVLCYMKKCSILYTEATNY